ncbi:MAG: conjugal transfer protein TraG N-terminal domain-containing protein [Janthinobacterium lividum]
MDYVIYTFGGGEALWKVFNGLAILFKSDSGFNSVMKLSMTVGAVWAALSAMWGANVGLFARDYFIPTYVILNLMLIPTTSVHIIDEVNPDFRYSKVDNVPIGIAAVASTASRISKLLTNTLEHSLQTADANHYGKTGPMFAARLVAMARDIRVTDPVERQNLKDFVKQCFTLPFLWTNIGGKKASALESQDLLGFISSNPHQWLGSYWRDSTNGSRFLYCGEGATRAKAVTSLETPRGLAELASNLFGSAQVDTAAASVRLNKYFGDAWAMLSHQTKSAHQMAEQEMMINVYRESVDDKRQEFGLERLNPGLIAASSARAKTQQNSGFLVSAQMVGSMLPSLQSTMLAILCILFAIVFPMAMLPGGLKTLGMWVKLILWVESWPVFYAIINSVALIMASNRGASYTSTGGGLSLLTQNGLADAAYDAYCYAEGFMAIVPVMAWAVISGGGYALANLSGTVTRSVDGLSSKLGAEMTDGNLSFDNQSYHNMSVGGYQLAQQQRGPNISDASSYADGEMARTYSTGGKMFFQENMSNLKNNVTETYNSTAALTDASQRAKHTALAHGTSATESMNDGLNQLYNLTQQMSEGSGTQDTFGHTDTAGDNKDLRKAYDIAQQISATTGISSDKAFNLSAHAGLNSGALKFFGANFGASADTKLSDHEQQAMNMSKSTGLQQQFNESLSRGLQHSFGRQGNYSNQAQKQAMDSIQGSFNTAKSHQDQASASLTESENYSRAASISETSGYGITTMATDEVLAHVAQKFNVDKGTAAKWQSDHSDAYKQEAASYMTEKQKPLIDSLRSDHALSDQQIQQRFEHYKSQVPNTVSRDDVSHVKDLSEKQDLGNQGRQDLGDKVRDLREHTGQGFKHNDQEIHQGKEKVTKEQQQRTDHYQQESNKGSRTRMGENVSKAGEGLSTRMNETLKETTPSSGNQQPMFFNSTKASAEQNQHLTTPPLRVEDSQQARDMNDGKTKMENRQTIQDPMMASASSAESSFGPSNAPYSSGHVQFPKEINITRDYISPSSLSSWSQENNGSRAQSSFEGESLASTQGLGHQQQSSSTPVRQEVITDKGPAMAPQRTENMPLQTAQVNSQISSQTEIMPVNQSSLSQEDYDLARSNSKISAQGRELRELRQMMETTHDRSSYEEVLPMPSDPLKTDLP